MELRGGQRPVKKRTAGAGAWLWLLDEAAASKKRLSWDRLCPPMLRRPMCEKAFGSALIRGHAPDHPVPHSARSSFSYTLARVSKSDNVKVLGPSLSSARPPKPMRSSRDPMWKCLQHTSCRRSRDESAHGRTRSRNVLSGRPVVAPCGNCAWWAQRAEGVRSSGERAGAPAKRLASASRRCSRVQRLARARDMVPPLSPVRGRRAVARASASAASFPALPAGPGSQIA